MELFFLFFEIQNHKKNSQLNSVKFDKKEFKSKLTFISYEKLNKKQIKN